MKALLLSANDISGGASKAAYRLHQGFYKIGVFSQMIVDNKYSDNSNIFSHTTKIRKGFAKLKPTLDKLPLNLYPNRDISAYSIQWIRDNIPAQVAQIQPDIVNLHWIADSYLQIESLAKLNKPLVWTLHDMWAFTGGCHYSGDCEKYKESCGSCPQLHSSKETDLSRWVWKRKARSWKDLNLTIVTPSNWLAKCAISSSLFTDLRIEVIPNGIDTDRFKPLEKSVARTILGLPQDKRLILFGSVKATSDVRKGFHLLQPALQKISHRNWVVKTELVIFGASKSINPPNLGLQTHYLGILNDDISLAIVYAAADLFIAPSIEDNLPNTVIESLACGTPCLAFDLGGMPDMIEHKQNGYLARPFEVDSLVRGITWILENEERLQKLGIRAREKAKEEFSLERQAYRYLSLFQEISEIISV